jgi:Fe(3+) dicitrate transport protein
LSELGAPGSNSNRVGDALATAIYVQDQFRAGRFSVTPGVRWESIRHRRFDYSREDPDRSTGPDRLRQNDLSVLIPGVGMAYELSSSHRLFAGIHKGFSPPGTGSTEEVDPEESLNLELGYRFRAGLLHADVTAFFSDYDNLLGVETVSGGGATTGDLFNGGAVMVRGLEASMGQRWRVGEGLVPFRVAYTFTQSEFQTSFLTSFADWSPEVQVGDRLPYIPEHQLHLMVGYERGDWSGNLKMSYMAEMRTVAGQGAILAAEATDERTVFDFGLQWNGLERASFYLQVRNLLDETFLVSRRPYGARPGLDRTLLGGASFRF